MRHGLEDSHEEEGLQEDHHDQDNNQNFPGVGHQHRLLRVRSDSVFVKLDFIVVDISDVDEDIYETSVDMHDVEIVPGVGEVA